VTVHPRLGSSVRRHRAAGRLSEGSIHVQSARICAVPVMADNLPLQV